MTLMPLSTSLSFLRELPLFDGVAAGAFGQFGLRPSESRFRARDDLFTFGERREKIWFVREGWVRTRVHSPAGQEATSIFSVGDVLGCWSNLGLETYPYSASAITDAEVLSVPAAAFERWLRSDARAACRMIEILDRRLHESMAMRAINAERAAVRLSLTLGLLAEKFGPKIPATRTLLADLTGLRPETCSRMLSILRRRGVLRVSPRRIEVLRPERLTNGPDRS